MFLLAIFGWNDLQAEIIIYPVPNGIYYARHNSFVRQETKSG